jgi:Domain of unknown function (DUF4372)
MNTRKTLFAQLMDFLPWSTFGRIVARHDGDRAVRKLPCAEQYRALAFAQLTYRESLRDIEVCLSVPAYGGHQSTLVRRIHILENLDTAPLVRDGVTEFMFVLGQPRYRGAVQAIINPVAIR